MPQPTANRRKHARVSLHLLARVAGYDNDGSAWEEVSSTADLSAGGAALPLKHAVAAGQVIRLALNMPLQLRWFDEGQPVYRVYSLVRSVRSFEGGAWKGRGDSGRDGRSQLLPMQEGGSGGRPRPIAGPRFSSTNASITYTVSTFRLPP